MSGIVIAATAPKEADTLRDMLAGSFTQIRPLPNNAEAARRAIDQADLLMVIIDEEWATTITQSPLIYAAIEQGLSRSDLPVLNVFVNEAITLPPVTDLPADIRGVAYMSQYKLSSGEQYRASVTELAREIAQILKETSDNFSAQVSSPTAKAQAAKTDGGIPFNLIMIFAIVSFALILIIAPQVEENARGSFQPVEEAENEPENNNADLIIGFAGGLSGSAQARGQAMLNGVNLALMDRPTITLASEHTVDLLVQDTACSAVQGQRVAELFVSSPNIAGVIGHMCNTSCGTAQSLYTASGLPAISPACNAPALTATDNTFHRVVPPTTAEAVAIAAYLADTNGVALIYDEQPHADPFAAAFIAAYPGELGADYATESTTIDYDAIVTTIQSNEATAVYYIGRATNAGEVRRRLVEAGLGDLPFVASVLGDVAAFSTSAGDAADGALMLQIIPPEADALANRYEDVYDTAPESIIFAHAYDATNLLLDAIETTATEDADGVVQLDYAALNAAIRQYSGEGITGALNCTDAGECAQANTAVFSVQSGELVPVD